MKHYQKSKMGSCLFLQHWLSIPFVENTPTNANVIKNFITQLDDVSLGNVAWSRGTEEIITLWGNKMDMCHLVSELYV